MGSSITPDQWAAAREAWEGGAPNRVAGEAGGMSGETVRARAKKEGWTRRTGALEAEAAARAAQTAAATVEANRRWQNRRAQEADAAGLTASKARQELVKAMDRGDDKLVRAVAIAYGILIDKAQLLSGAATARLDDVRDPKSRASAIIDELDTRRRQHQAKTA